MSEQIEKMREYLDVLFELKEKHKNAEEQERFWRGETTALTNQINEVQKGVKQYCKEIFGE